MAKIYVIEEHCDGAHSKDIGYSTVRRDVDSYLSVFTGGQAYRPSTASSKIQWFEEETNPKVFKRHQPGIWYQSKEGLYLYSFRIENSI